MVCGPSTLITIDAKGALTGLAINLYIDNQWLTQLKPSAPTTQSTEINPSIRRNFAATTLTYGWNPNDLPYGWHTLKAVGQNALNEKVEKQIFVMKNCPPKVTFKSPLNDSEIYTMGDLTVEAVIQPGNRILKVDLYMDDIFQFTSQEPIFTWRWQPKSMGLPMGRHIFKAVATSDGGLTDQARYFLWYWPVFPPRQAVIERHINRNLFSIEYIDQISWEGDAANKTVAKYRLYQIMGITRQLLKEFNPQERSWTLRHVDNLTTQYQLVTVNQQGIESDPVVLMAVKK